MNPLFQALTGGMGLPGASSAQTHMQSAGAPTGAFPGVLGRVQQLASMFQNPQQLVQRYFPDAPAEVQGDPEQLIGWLQQTGRVNPQTVQMARSMMGR